MITHVVWDLGDTIITPPPGGQDLQPIDLYPDIHLRPDVELTLQTLTDWGYQHAVLSNTATSDSGAATRMLERLGIAHYFEFIYATQSELTHDKPEKPNPVVFDLVLDALGIEPEHAVMVGNSWDNDILGANRSRIHAIWLQRDSVSVRRDFTSPVQCPPWIVPVWDVVDVPKALTILQVGFTHEPAGLD
ncbi:HAD family hydrolase [Alicyclobacillus acidiphilus]|uniref:HAD family hydrolase n=1 Tax=Alicyclobacillus acidiphilus TaxID=182455 RepID=UPI0009F86E61|nr:HAD family hydrolase [Alicyclobacillus acidiphilus]